MKMQETERSLATYFALSAAATTFSAWSQLSDNPVLAVFTFGFAMAYAYLATRLVQLLQGTPSRILWILNTGSIFLVFALVINVYAHNRSAAGMDILGLLVNWYLLRNVKRLAAEKKADAVATGLGPLAG